MAKHYIKVFFTDSPDSHVVNLDGENTEVTKSKDELAQEIGRDILGEIEQIEAPYGCRVDYHITPINTDPFK